jgi:hypothetical protein
MNDFQFSIDPMLAAGGGALEIENWKPEIL